MTTEATRQNDPARRKRTWVWTLLVVLTLIVTWLGVFFLIAGMLYLGVLYPAIVCGPECFDPFGSRFLLGYMMFVASAALVLTVALLAAMTRQRQRSTLAGTWLGVAVSQVMLMATSSSGYLYFVYIDLLGATAVGAIPVGAWLGLYWPEIMGRLEQARSSWFEARR